MIEERVDGFQRQGLERGQIIFKITGRFPTKEKLAGGVQTYEPGAKYLS